MNKKVPLTSFQRGTVLLEEEDITDKRVMGR
ncbi:hypothetical protein SJDPG11_01880 [Porphyromonas gingivalis SJD11]|nr:hypothetical protein SJDPG11_01880 [Porphyromonas gingivalis SJD11]